MNAWDKVEMDNEVVHKVSPNTAEPQRTTKNHKKPVRVIIV